MHYLVDQQKDIQPDQNFLSSLINMEDTPANHTLIDKLASAGLIRPLVAPQPDPKSKPKEDPQIVQARTDGQNRYMLYYAADEGKSDYILETMLKQGFSPKGFLDRGTYHYLTIVQALQADIDQLPITETVVEEESYKKELKPTAPLLGQGSDFDYSKTLITKQQTLKRRIAIIKKALAAT